MKIVKFNTLSFYFILFYSLLKILFHMFTHFSNFITCNIIFYIYMILILDYFYSSHNLFIRKNHWKYSSQTFDLKFIKTRKKNGLSRKTRFQKQKPIPRTSRFDIIVDSPDKGLFGTQEILSPLTDENPPKQALFSLFCFFKNVISY